MSIVMCASGLFFFFFFGGGGTFFTNNLADKSWLYGLKMEWAKFGDGTFEIQPKKAGEFKNLEVPTPSVCPPIIQWRQKRNPTSPRANLQTRKALYFLYNPKIVHCESYVEIHLPRNEAQPVYSDLVPKEHDFHPTAS